MTIATGKPIGRPRKLTEQQLAELNRRALLHRQNTVARICADLKISNSTYNEYMKRRMNYGT